MTTRSMFAWVTAFALVTGAAACSNNDNLTSPGGGTPGGNGSGDQTGALLVNVTTPNDPAIAGGAFSLNITPATTTTNLPIGGTAGEDSVYVPNLSVGQHVATLGGVPQTCTVPDNPRTVQVTLGDTTRVAFAVVCAP
jgi:hypothetical protein